MKKNASTILIVCVFLCGLVLFLYPSVSNFYNESKNGGLIDDYISQTQGMSKQDYTAAWEAARLYNENMRNPETLEKLGLDYENVLNTYGGGIMGYLEIPKIRVSLVIVHDVDEDELQDSVGHMKETALPVGGKGTHAAMAGHSGLPSAKLLTNLEVLEPGDMFYIHVLGERLDYRVDQIAVVEPNDRSLLQPDPDKDLVTLITCTPYGINSHRLLVRGVRVSADTPVEGEYVYIGNELQVIKPILLVPGAMVALGLAAGMIYGAAKLIFRRKGKHRAE
ncbi:MAG: class C sortase [Firmicutes bacterium]|nr:class C sortase [Bacillota bacterium]